MSGFERRFEPRRLELINGAGGRRVWSADAKAAVLDETLLPGAVVSVVARRHGLSPQQVFTWRRDALQAGAALPTFVPAVIAPEPVVAEPARTKPAHRRTKRSPSCRGAAGIEVEAGGVTVRIGDGASPATIAAVIGALKGSP